MNQAKQTQNTSNQNTNTKNSSMSLVPTFTRNPIGEFDAALIADVNVEAYAIQQDIARMLEQPKHKTLHIPSINRAAWLLKSVTCIDLTTLAGDDTPEHVKNLCAKAKQPVSPAVLETLGMKNEKITVAAVCVYHEMIETARAALANTGIPVAAVSAGFPAGLSPFAQRLAEVKASVAAGAQEIDIVISRQLVLMEKWEALYDEIAAFREACGTAHLKTILATGELGTLRHVYQASMVAMMAGTDFIKTSTGKEAINATLPVSLTMVRALRDYGTIRGYQVGFKPAGGIRSADDALAWLALMREEAGREWLKPHLFRFGASSLLSNVAQELIKTTKSLATKN